MTPAITIPPRSNGESSIWIKGTRKGLSITLGEGDWSELLRELDLRLSQADAFFRGSQVNLSTGKRDLDQTELKELVDTLLKHDIKLISLRTGSESAAEAAQALGVRLGLPEATLDQVVSRTSTEEPSEGLLLRRTLRSGQSIRHPGHVVIIGDVNPGAEIIAGGDVVVWGKLRGMVHAGALGDNGAIVCALELMPTQLRIGNYIATSPAEKSRGIQPEVAFVLNDQIVAEPWSAK
ncbi:MAG: septum site-determining protein MinC [Anaerolineae bacterium]